MTSATTPATSPPLPASVRRGYGLGLGGDRRVRHGARADAAALPHRHASASRPRVAGVIVFAAQGLGRRAQPGRRADQRPVDAPARPRRPVPAPGRAAARGRASRCSSPARPRLAVAGGRRGSLVFFLACATAYAFFQVPYVAMPAEITDDYDERTRLMTWRVAILALTILLSGGAVAGDPRRGRRPRRLPRRWASFVAALIVVGVVGAYVGTRRAPVGARRGRRGTPARPAADRRPTRATSGCC